MPQAGYVYIVHGIGTAYIKVGKTTNIERRLGELAQGVPFPLRLLSIELVHDMDAVERALKMRYKAFRTRGEWCELSPEALAYWPIAAHESRPLKPLMVRTEKPVLSLEERILTKLTDRGAMTSRELQKYFRGQRPEEIQTVLLRLLDTGLVSLARVGKRREYLRLVSASTEEQFQ